MADEAEEVKTEATAPKKTVIMVCLGRREVTGGKKRVFWQRIEENENNGENLYPDSSKQSAYEGKSIYPHAGPGTIITIDQGPDGKSVYPSTSRHFGFWKNKEDLAEWQAAVRVIEIAEESKQKTMREIKKSLPREVLAPYRNAYLSLGNRRHRANFLAWIIQEITDLTGGRKEDDDD